MNNITASNVESEKLEALLRREEEASDELREERNAWKKQAETLASALANIESLSPDTENSDKKQTSWLGGLVD